MKPFLSLLKKSALLVISLIILLVLLLMEENWRARHAWQNYRAAKEAQGDILDYRNFIPPPVPDDQNFAMTPLLRNLFNEKGAKELREKMAPLEAPFGTQNNRPSLGNFTVGKPLNLDAWKAYYHTQDLSSYFEQHGALILQEISQASQLPYARFPVDYYNSNVGLIPLPHLGRLLRLASIYGCRAVLELQQQRTDSAFEDTLTIFHLADSLKNEPIAISKLLRFHIWQQGVQTIWEGLSSHSWTDAQLQKFQSILSQPDFLEEIKHAMQLERACTILSGTQYLDHRTLFSQSMKLMGKSYDLSLMPFIPSCVIYENMLTACHYSDEHLIPSAKREALLTHQSQPAAPATPSDLGENGYSTFCFFATHPYSGIAFWFANGQRGFVETAAYRQTCNDQALIACALERYRIAQGHYPTSLDQLIPTYLKSLPLDLMTGKPMRYTLQGDNNYLLYSLGWSQKDYQGRITTQTNDILDRNKSNWVWSLARPPK